MPLTAAVAPVIVPDAALISVLPYPSETLVGPAVIVPVLTSCPLDSERQLVAPMIVPLLVDAQKLPPEIVAPTPPVEQIVPLLANVP